MKIRAFNIETNSPSDVCRVAAYLDAGEFSAQDVVCVLGKTEGNGGRNDFTRALAMSALEHLFAPRLGVTPDRVQDQVIFSFSGGTEGVTTPHMIVFVRDGEPATEPSPHKRLAVAIGHTREFAPEEIGRMPQIHETARTVRDVVRSLRVDSPQDVHLIQMKGAIPPFDHAVQDELAAEGISLRCDMVHSRGASALGVALALDEISADALSDDVVCRDFSLYSGVASCSAKPGLRRTEILAFGNSRYWEGDLVIGHGCLADILDIDGIARVAQGVGIDVTFPPDPAQVDKLVGVFAKSEADPRGVVRGRRHTMLRDDDIGDTRYSRCVLASVLSAVLGDTRVYVSTRAEHHGPLGGGPLAIVARAGA